MTKISQKDAERELRQGAAKATLNDLNKIFKKRDNLEKKFKKNGPLKKFAADLKLLFSIVRDYISGSYRQTPWHSIAAIVAALLYVLNPFDLIPDFIPGIGYIDDAAVVAVCLKMIESDLQEYQTWLLKKHRAVC
jgi:uncharacterized membrane protein YkvA (DUF1232 family)